MAEIVNIAREVVDAFNDSDWERSRAPMKDDTVYNEVGTARQLKGPEEIISALKGWKKAMPDVKGKVTNALVSGNTAVLEVTWHGTHTGPLESPGGTIPASGKKQTTPSAWVFEFDGEKIKESHHYFDMLSFLKQIGAIPEKM